MNKIIALLLALTAWPAIGANIENGEDLHFTHCTGCHDESAYTRKDRRVQSLERLGAQVRFCRDNLDLTWFDEEVDDVIEYLNQNYYHFQ